MGVLTSIIRILFRQCEDEALRKEPNVCYEHGGLFPSLGECSGERRKESASRRGRRHHNIIACGKIDEW